MMPTAARRVLIWSLLGSGVAGRETGAAATGGGNVCPILRSAAEVDTGAIGTERTGSSRMATCDPIGAAGGVAACATTGAAAGTAAGTATGIAAGIAATGAGLRRCCGW